MTKILALFGDAPAPLNNGGRMRSHMFGEALVQLGEVDVVYQQLIANESPHDAPSIYHNVYRVPRKDRSPRPRLQDALLPWEIRRHHNDAFLEQMEALLSEHQYHLIFARYVPQAYYAVLLRRQLHCPILVDVDDITYRKQALQFDLEGYANSRDRWRKQLDTAIYRRLYKYVLSKATATFSCNQEDSKLLVRDLHIPPPLVAPNAVRFPLHTTYTGHNHRTLLFCGDLGFGPNIDGLLWFTEQVLPKVQQHIPDVKLNLVGRHPVPPILALQAMDAVSVFPNVPDVAPYYAKADVALIPIRFGAGTRIKMIEAASFSVPTVATSLGAMGLDAKCGIHSLIADEAQAFADACITLLKDHQRAAAIASQAYSWAHKAFSHDSTVKGIVKVLETYL